MFKYVSHIVIKKRNSYFVFALPLLFTDTALFPLRLCHNTV